MEVTGNLAEYAARPLYKIENGNAKPAFDERRGEHLLSPGDLVRHGYSFWEVTGVHLSTSLAHSIVTMKVLGDKEADECSVPLVFLDNCRVYLLADRRSKS